GGVGRGGAGGREERALTALDAGLARQFQALRRARTPKAVSRAISEMRAALATAKATLERLDPPVAVTSAHAALLDAVDALAADLTDAGSAVADRQVCAGSSAAILISRSAGAHQVRAASTKIAKADRAHPYRVGGFLPPGRPYPNRRPGHGAEVRPPTPGRGRANDRHRT